MVEVFESGKSIFSDVVGVFSIVNVVTVKLFYMVVMVEKDGLVFVVGKGLFIFNFY